MMSKTAIKENHVKTVFVYKCEWCAKTGKNKTAVANHIVMKHPEKVQ